MIAFAAPAPEKGTRAEARNKEIKRCLKMHPDYIFMMDDDQTMPDEGLELMLSWTGKFDIVVIDTPPHDSTMENITTHPDGSIAWCTVACCLIRASVFEKLLHPWFDSRYDYVKEGVVGGRHIIKRLDKSTDNNVGEDVFFVRNALEAGLKIKFIGNIKCKHFKI